MYNIIIIFQDRRVIVGFIVVKFAVIDAHAVNNILLYFRVITIIIIIPSPTATRCTREISPFSRRE